MNSSNSACETNRLFTCGGILRCPICHLLIRDFRNKWIPWIRIRKKTTDAQKHFTDCERWRPLVFQNIKANAAISCNIWMLDWRHKDYFGRLEGIIGWEMNLKIEDTTHIG